MEAKAACEILKYVIIHWRQKAAGVRREALLKGELLISIEASSSKHQANTFHCATTIAFAGSTSGDRVPRQLLKEIQSLLSDFSGKLTWRSEDTGCSQDLLEMVPFQMKFEVDEKPRTLMTDCLIIKQFLHRTSVVHPKIAFHYHVKVNGALSKETFGGEKEPLVKLSNGIGLLTSWHHYMRPGSAGAKQECREMQLVLGRPVPLVIPDEEAVVVLRGELTLTPAAALCPCGTPSRDQSGRVSSAFEHPLTVFDDNSYLFDWKKFHLCTAPNVNICLEEEVVLPDVSYRTAAPEKSQAQESGTEEQALLLFLFVDSHSGFPAQVMEAWGMWSLLLTHLNRILLENHSLVQGAVQLAVEQAWGQHLRGLRAQQKLQASIPVAVNSILSIVTGSTSSSFRAVCLQTLQAADTRELGSRLHNAFHRTLPLRLLHPPPYGLQQLLPEPSSTEMEAEAESLEESFPESCCSGGAPKPKKCCQSEGVVRAQAAGWSPHLSLREATLCSVGTGPTCSQPKGWGSPGTRREDALWLQEVANLSEWLGAGPPRSCSQ